MSLDGIFLRSIKNELSSNLINSKVDKIYQPSTEEIIVSLRTKAAGGKKLLFCARAQSPRIHVTTAQYENPPVPPMLCMLLRKRLGGATLTDIRQSGSDRILFVDFLAINEMGDKEKLTLVMEIMAQYSNVILVAEDGKIIDALKRVDYSKSSKRLVLPGVKYELPPAQNKLDLFENTVDEIIAAIKEKPGKQMSQALISSVMGMSPIVSREIAYKAFSEDKAVCEASEADFEKLKNVLGELQTKYENGSSRYFMVKDRTEKPVDFSFLDIGQYGSAALIEEYDTASALLDEYYSRRDMIDLMAHRSSDLRKLLQNTKERIVRKIENQRAELSQCENREILRIRAELINANIYRIEKGSSLVELENYYDDNKPIKIPMDPALTPVQNSQKYFKDYKKTYTAEKKLQEQIEYGIDELNYIDTVIDSLSRVETDRDIAVIREELIAGGYVKKPKDKYQKNGRKVVQKRTTSLPPIEYETTDGFRVLVGRNNIQNDKLSLKMAQKTDLWLHTKDFPGSHVILESKNGEISDNAIEEAAIIAAVNSTAKDAHKVPVNYTRVKNLKKPPKAKPGKVIYHEYYTLYTTPNEAFAEAHKKKHRR